MISFTFTCLFILLNDVFCIGKLHCSLVVFYANAGTFCPLCHDKGIWEALEKEKAQVFSWPQEAFLIKQVQRLSPWCIACSEIFVGWVFISLLLGPTDYRYLTSDNRAQRSFLFQVVCNLSHGPSQCDAHFYSNLNCTGNDNIFSYFPMLSCRCLVRGPPTYWKCGITSLYFSLCLLWCLVKRPLHKIIFQFNVKICSMVLKTGLNRLIRQVFGSFSSRIHYKYSPEYISFCSKNKFWKQVEHIE